MQAITSMQKSWLKMKIEKVSGKEALLQALKENDWYCLNKTPGEGNLCMCHEFLERPKTGLCQCGLYNKTEI